MALTADLIRKAKPGQSRQFLWDTVVPGLGLVVYPSGRKAFVYQGTGTGDRRRNIVAGGLVQARKLALAIKAGQADALPVQTPERPCPKPDALTVNQLLDRWLASLAERPEPPVTLPRIKACMDNHVRRKIGSVALSKLTRAQVLAVRDGLAAQGLRGMANQVIAYVRAALRWAEDAQLIAEAPRWRLSRLKLGTRAHALTEQQWGLLRDVLSDPHSGLHGVGRLALQALVLTGCRKGEISGLRWEAIGPDNSLMLIRTCRK